MTKRVARGQQVNYCNPKIGTEETESLVEMCHVCGVHTSYSHQPSPAQLLQCNRCGRLLAAFMLLFNTFMCAAPCIQVHRVNRFKVFYSSEIMKHKYIVYRHKTLGHVTKV